MLPISEAKLSRSRAAVFESTDDSIFADGPDHYLFI